MVALVAAVASSKNPILSLPGLAEFPDGFRQYSGYINVNATAGKELFYWFVESQRAPAEDPVLLWMQGGPGCSGLLSFWTEIGPFVLQPVGWR